MGRSNRWDERESESERGKREERERREREEIEKIERRGRELQKKEGKIKVRNSSKRRAAARAQSVDQAFHYRRDCGEYTPRRRFQDFSIGEADLIPILILNCLSNAVQLRNVWILRSREMLAKGLWHAAERAATPPCG